MLLTSCWSGDMPLSLSAEVLHDFDPWHSADGSSFQLAISHMFAYREGRETSLDLPRASGMCTSPFGRNWQKLFLTDLENFQLKCFWSSQHTTVTITQNCLQTEGTTHKKTQNGGVRHKAIHVQSNRYLMLIQC